MFLYIGKELEWSCICKLFSKAIYYSFPKSCKVAHKPIGQASPLPVRHQQTPRSRKAPSSLWLPGRASHTLGKGWEQEWSRMHANTPRGHLLHEKKIQSSPEGVSHFFLKGLSVSGWSWPGLTRLGRGIGQGCWALRRPWRHSVRWAQKPTWSWALRIDIHKHVLCFCHFVCWGWVGRLLLFVELVLRALVQRTCKSSVEEVDEVWS